MHSPTCQKQTDRSSEQGEQDGFCEELTCNPKTRRAKRKPDGKPMTHEQTDAEIDAIRQYLFSLGKSSQVSMR